MDKWALGTHGHKGCLGGVLEIGGHLLAFEGHGHHATASDGLGPVQYQRRRLHFNLATIRSKRYIYIGVLA
jgi:hypothetical protein